MRYARGVCGRYTDEASFSDIRLTFNAADQPLPFPWVPRFNIAPSHGAGYEQPFIVQDGAERVVKLGRWWLIPSWWKKPLKELPTAFNARSEEVAGKPLFRDAFRWSRCLVPATGWREYVPAGRAKQPYHFHLSHSLFAFAGLASRWVSPDGEVIDSFSIMTTAPSEKAAQYHDRMPLVLARELYDAWLDPRGKPAQTLTEAQRRAAETPIEIYASNPVANSTKFEGPEAVAPLT